MKWNCDNNDVSNDTIDEIETELGIKFPEDFIEIMKKYDGGYPTPNRITINGKEEVLNNLVSFIEDDVSYILDIINDIENFTDYNLVPIAEDPFGNLYCYSFHEESCEIVFWNHEDGEQINFVCDSFEKLISMLH